MPDDYDTSLPEGSQTESKYSFRKINTPENDHIFKMKETFFIHPRQITWCKDGN